MTSDHRRYRRFGRQTVHYRFALRHDGQKSEVREGATIEVPIRITPAGNDTG